MNKFNLDELRALRSAARAVEQSDQEITTRLEAAYDQISFMLELIHDQSSTETINKVCDEIEHLIDKLQSTLVIAGLVIRERNLERKLAELDQRSIPDKVTGIKERIMSMLSEEKSYDSGAEGADPLDPDTMKRIKERLELESLVDSLYTSEAAEKVKEMLKKVKGLRSFSRRQQAAVSTDKIRPYNPMQDRMHRELDSTIPASKGVGYELPDSRTKTED